MSSEAVHFFRRCISRINKGVWETDIRVEYRSIENWNRGVGVYSAMGIRRRSNKKEPYC